jgi:hypothetical protein
MTARNGPSDIPAYMRPTAASRSTSRSSVMKQTGSTRIGGGVRSSMQLNVQPRTSMGFASNNKVRTSMIVPPSKDLPKKSFALYRREK